MGADLHLHSRASDGSHTLQELLTLAASGGLDCIALTDHDYLAHLDEAVALGQSRGIRVVPGVEISACDPASGRKVHILGYFLSSRSKAVASLCAPVLAARHHRTLELVAALGHQGIPVSLPGVEEFAWGSLAGDSLLDRSPVLYHQHVRGFVDALDLEPAQRILAHAIIKTCLEGSGATESGRGYPSAVDAVKAIRADGGMAVLAHPGKGALWDLVPLLVAAGLEGMELDHPAHGHAERQQVRELCARWNLVATGGSDFHGSFEPGPLPGTHVCPEQNTLYFKHPRGRELLFAEKLLMEAGAYLRERRNGASLDVENKNGDHRDLVSECDLAVDHLVRSRVKERWPWHCVLTEEGPVPDIPPEARLWILDPVDGTTNFVRFGRDYTVSLAYWEGRTACFGLVYDVAAGMLFRGVAGGGIQINGQPVPLSAGARGETPRRLDGLIVDASLNTICAFDRRGVDMHRLSRDLCAHRSLGCASLALVRVALGELDAFLSDRLRVWDWAAAVVLLGESGGVWTGLFGCAADPHHTGKVPFMGAVDSGAAKALFAVLDSPDVRNKEDSNQILKMHGQI